MPGWYSIRHIQLLTCQCFRSMIGVIFMVTWRRRLPPTHPSQGARKLIWEYFLIYNMREIKSPDDPELDTLSSWKILQLLGFPRIKQQLKLQCLERNLLRWILEWKHSGDCNTSCAWWECQSRYCRWFMGKICQLFTTHSNQIPHWRKSWIQFVAMRLGNLWQWKKFWWGMCHNCTTRQKFVRNLFQLDQIRSTLLVMCYMNHMSSNVLVNVHQYKSVDGHLWMCIADGTEKWLPCSE